MSTEAPSSCSCGCGSCLRAHDVRKAVFFNALKAERRSAHLCVDCGQPADPGQLKCAGCRDAFNRRMTAFRRHRRSESRCPHCGAAVDGFERCEKCRRVNASGTKALRDRRKDQGICTDCDQPAVPGRARCETHLAYMAERKRTQRSRRNSTPFERLRALAAEAAPALSTLNPQPSTSVPLTPYAERLIAATEAQGRDTDAFTRIGRSLLSHFRGAHTAATPAKRH